ncbi:hypothetical protein [Crenothrix sp.]|uniref:hypothetical protein n=1 Tax=Crenothrix sp. TaxID=3100433 RepID=UPI00374DB353
MRNISTYAVQGVNAVIDANFYLSLIIMIFGSAFSLSEQYSIFQFNVDVYGELANNLRAIMGYLAFTETLIFFFCFFTKQYQHFILVGFFLLIMIGSLQFYGQINSVEIDANLYWCLLYAGLSHILFGTMAVNKNKRSLGMHNK